MSSSPRNSADSNEDQEDSYSPTSSKNPIDYKKLSKFFHQSKFKQSKGPSPQIKERMAALRSSRNQMNKMTADLDPSSIEHSRPSFDLDSGVDDIDLMKKHVGEASMEQPQREPKRKTINDMLISDSMVRQELAAVKEERRREKLLGPDQKATKV